MLRLQESVADSLKQLRVAVDNMSSAMTAYSNTLEVLLQLYDSLFQHVGGIVIAVSSSMTAYSNTLEVLLLLLTSSFPHIMHSNGSMTAVLFVLCRR